MSQKDAIDHQNNTLTIETSTSKASEMDKYSSQWLRLELMMSLVNQIAIGFIAIYMCWKFLNVEYTTRPHALLCTFGFVVLMSEGIMTHYNGNITLFLYTRKTKTTIHWILQALGGCLGIAGGILIMFQKKEHFNTRHGQFGLAAMILCGISMISGLSALYSQKLRRILRPLLNKTVHNVLGVSTFVIGMIAQRYGVLWLQFWKVTPEFQKLLEILTWLVLVLSCWGPLKAFWNKSKNICQNF